jgi:hypothetical protein
VTRIAVLLLGCLVLAGSAAATSSPPRLAITARTPTVVVHGTGFRPRERVTVTAGTVVARARATRLGAFTVDTGLGLSRCTAFVVRAVGSAGSAVLLKLPQPACMPARSGG